MICPNANNPPINIHAKTLERNPGIPMLYKYGKNQSPNMPEINIPTKPPKHAFIYPRLKPSTLYFRSFKPRNPIAMINPKNMINPINPV